MAYKQDSRMCVVNTPLGKDVLILRSMSVDEVVSELFRIQLDLVSHNEKIKFTDIIGKPIAVNVHLASGAVRTFHGIVSRFTQGGSYAMDGDDKGLVSYQAELVPWLWNLTRVSNCRVWEKKSVIEIVEDVFKKLGFADYEFAKLGGSYEPIEYCVQYRETDFNFVSRMLEEEGLGYAFRHESDKHTMVIFDTSASCADCPDAKTLKYSGTTGSAGNEAEIDALTVTQVMPSGKYALNGYDFSSPSDDLLAPIQTKSALGGNSKYEIYDAPSNYTASKQGNRYVKLRMEAEEAASHQAIGSSACPALTCGTHFTLKGHFRDALNQRYLLTRVQHTVTESIGLGSGSSSYENSFTCLPDSIPYRPVQRTPKPSIPGTQTALVVGPKGEEIHTDKYGRVRVQFYWDRGGKGDGSDVVWVRVAQASAGKKWGSIFIPRIGQEVVVTFLDGDPDRPLITGVVYNAEQMPPYDLDANKTQSGIKTRSSKGGGADNFNEIMFEDKKGEELFFVQAEKDQEINVKNDRAKTIGNNQTEDIGKDETVTIGGNRSVSVAKDHTEEVDGVEKLSVGKGRTRTVGDNETIDVGKDQTLTIQGSRSITVQKNQTIEIQKDQQEKIGGRYQASVTKEFILQAKKIQMTADDEISIKTGSAEIVMKKNGDITINGKKISIKGSGDVIVKGSKIAEN